MILFFRIPPLLKSPEGNPRIGGGKYTALEKFAIFDRNRRLSRKRYEICP